ncbi:MAG: hypothetical protein AB7O49_15520 [Sphingomonadales bacterium]
MIEQTVLALGASRMLAIRHLGRAVAAWYGLDERAVLDDAARFGGERTIVELPRDRHKPVADYLCGRLLLPEAGRRSD